MPKLPTAQETANLLVQHVVQVHGIPFDIVSDRGPHLISRVWTSFCEAVGAKVSLSSGFHPQTNSQCESANQDLKAKLCCIAAKDPSSWGVHLPWVAYAVNSLSSSATGMSLFECSLGYLPPLFPEQEREIAVPSVKDHLRHCRMYVHIYLPNVHIWTTAQASLLCSVKQNRKTADKHQVLAPDNKPGQKIWLSSRDEPLKTDSRKLAPRYNGPYGTEKIINPMWSI